MLENQAFSPRYYPYFLSPKNHHFAFHIYKYLFFFVFFRHRRQLEELLKRQQNELHEYVLSMQAKQVSGKKE